MLLIIGYILVFGATLGGFMIAGGKPLVLLHVSEFVTIGGIAAGILVVASPLSTLADIVKKSIVAFTGAAYRKNDYMDLLKLLYELFQTGRKGGLIALEDHVITPQESSIFTKYPSFLKDPRRVTFLCDSLRPIIDGRIKPNQLESLLEKDLEAKEKESDHAVHMLTLVGDSLPGVGIIAAVLGIINTMAAISEGPHAVGEKVAAALTGTFLGILGAYGFVNPLANRIKMNNAVQMQYYESILKGISGFANGMAPLMAVEVARRCLDHSVQPEADELEEILRKLSTS